MENDPQDGILYIKSNSLLPDCEQLSLTALVLIQPIQCFILIDAL